MIENESELEILHSIHQSSGNIRQRDLATVLGKSLGMTNAILHRLTEKGLLMLRKINNRNMSYAVTPEGLRALASRSYQYFKRTIKNVVDYKDAIEAELCRLLQDGAASVPAGSARTLVLAGSSDLEFILEHLAHKYHLGWSVLPSQDEVAELTLEPGVILVWPEDYEAALPESLCNAPAIRLRSLLVA